MPAAPPIDAFQPAVLVKLYRALVLEQGQFQDAPYARLEELSLSFAVPMGRGYIDMVLRNLKKEGLVEDHQLSKTKAWRITETGVRYVETEDEDFDSAIHNLLEDGDGWLFDGTDIQPLHSEVLWEPLPLDRTDPSLEAIAGKIEELAEDAWADNGYAAEAPDERNFVVNALKAGAKAFREQGVIYRMQFDAFVWQPLTALARRFKRNAIGVLAESIRQAIKEHLKDTFKTWLS